MRAQPCCRGRSKAAQLGQTRLHRGIHHGNRAAMLGQVGMRGSSRNDHATGGIHIGSLAVHLQLHAPGQCIQQLHVAVAVRLLFAAVVAHRVIRGKQR
ncbi:hypothetical protein D3C72_1407610 [compost metagenome]